MNRRLACSIILMLLFLTGCLETRIVDEVSMIRAAAFDFDQERGLKITVSFPTFPEEAQQEELKQGIIQATGETTKGTRIELNKKSQKPIRFGQTRLLMFSQELAEQGIERTVNAMYRDPSVGNRILLAIAEGNDAGSYIETDLGDGELAGVHLPELIEQNQDTSILPPTNMHEFLFSLYNDGRDPYLPMLGKSSEEHVSIIGTALFSGETYHSYLNLDDSFILKMMLDTTRQAIQQFEVEYEGEQSYVVLEKLHSDVRRNLNKSGSVPVFTIDITMDGAIEDYDGKMNLDQVNIIEKMEQSIEDLISTRGEELLVQFQQGGIDPLGLGEKYRSTTRNWDSEEWQNTLYPSSEFQVHVDVKIIQSGAVE
ncbi:Ger(x)C family spore germination protein [Alkalihalobacillus sp. MEB130]|uniref:Ger(x)C family spore germination protein n=1 Tax=Alkalihalobacillus sp. MEB130 TaxID=2976704 RepID=UPI0028DF7EFC|nr:Ger(x)C family spore germination protein [Alkalihalobacillus sp. MEB130]MDT8860060.1 Ger(x)C family spore germination protein [Alkalihalobacillus sp. MEB130]